MLLMSPNDTPHILNAISRWDAEYFRSIAEHGYIYENQLAFLPLFPLLLNLFAKVLYFFFFEQIHFSTCIKLAGILMNMNLHIFTIITLKKLTDLMFSSQTFTAKTLIFYLFSPAKVFFISSYSESLFALFTFSGLYCLKSDKPFTASIFFSLSCATRSNGILNVGFIFYYCLNCIYVTQGKLNLFKEMMGCIIQTLLVVSPSLTYLWYGHYIFCKNATIPAWHLKTYGIMRGYNVRGIFKPEWCSYYIPNFYAHVQKTHWNVGFLRYYELKQIPNFALALPIIVIVISFAANYFNKRRDLIFNLGLMKSDNKYDGELNMEGHTISLHVLKSNDCDENVQDEYTKLDEGSVARSGVQEAHFKSMTRDFYCFILHGVFLCGFGLFFMHVQVTTRMVASSSPLLYWIAACVCKIDIVDRDIMADDVFKFFFNCSMSSIERAIKLYFIGYAIIGCAAHSLYLPWT
ncbi:GPI mannosyltransferase 2-like [Artemia franciscana]|uniref:GPI mannosyltransferase 2-like n=1 Tax=Artemia franciscana TaxID=6661 RepID=UPI0032DB1833